MKIAVEGAGNDSKRRPVFPGRFRLSRKWQVGFKRPKPVKRLVRCLPPGKLRIPYERCFTWYRVVSRQRLCIQRNISLSFLYILIYIYIYTSSGILNRGHELEVNLNRGCRWNANYISPLLDLWFKCSGKKKDLCFIFHSTGKMEETGILRQFVLNEGRIRV